MLGLYLHLPFCTTHCTYCPFAISTDLGLQDAYTTALVREIGAAAGGEVDSIYLGGGTPSRTSLANLSRAFDAIRARFALAPDAEISMEANPEDVTPASVEAWRALGVNRLSIGVQSFHDGELAAISRIHDRARALEAVRVAVAAGVRTNLDLMLGLPQQTAESFRETLDTAIDLGAGHLSLYMLDLEEKTPLQVQVARGRVALPEDDLVADLYIEAIEHLAGRGLAQYEISNFARFGEECRHNLRYWSRGEYFGFGMGAHSFIGGQRFANTRDIRRYIETAPDARDFSEELGAGEVRRETIFLQLRQTRGMCYEELVELCGQEGIEWTERGLQDGWLEKVGEERVAFTPNGFLQSNDFISQLF
jgi:putative oxygen-independent coproporphyrinogen III oxidase